MAKPIIGITCAVDHTGIEKAWTRLEYIDAVVAAGGVPVLLTHTEKPELVEQQLEAVDAVVGVGGADYHPALYGEAKHPMTMIQSRRRQDHDLALFRTVSELMLPALMICGSMQGLNVAHGGRLRQHLDELADRHNNRGYELAHKIRIESGSRLHDVIGSTKLMVNSDHHQAVSEPAEGFRIVARAACGTVEAIEPLDRDYPLLAVQWHPERLPDLPGTRALFAWLVDEAAKARPLRSMSVGTVRISPFF
jgi:putative glutamine amidotransferase